MAPVTARKHRQSSPLMYLDFGVDLDSLLPDVVATVATVTSIKIEREVTNSVGRKVWQDVTSEFTPGSISTNGRRVFFKPIIAAGANDQPAGEHAAAAKVTLSDGQVWTGYILFIVDATADESAA